MAIKTKWLASLSDGSTILEGKAPCEEIPGEPSPWQKLKLLLEERKCRITGLRIQVEKDGQPTRTYSLPSSSVGLLGNHEKWVTLKPIIPASYNYFRWVTKSLSTGTEQHQIEIRAHFQGQAVSLFVDEDEGNEAWVVVHGA